jgi:hypothetical protein
MKTEFTDLTELTDVAEASNSVTTDVFQALSPSVFHMRCPNCRKLYSVAPNLLSADGGGLSKFECVSCQAAFFAMKPELHGPQTLETHLLETQFASLYHQPTSLPTIDGFQESDELPALEQHVRSSVVSVPVDGRECPNCHALNALTNEECGRCEIIFSQFRPGVESVVANDVEFSESAELVMEWQSLQDDYQNTAKHEAFVRRCFEQGQLAFASHKYAQILAAAPDEATAGRMRSRVTGLASYGFDATANGLTKTNWSFPLPSFNSFIILLGTILVVVGLGFPNSRHTAGLGFAMIALAIGLRFFLRRPRT